MSTLFRCANCEWEGKLRCLPPTQHAPDCPDCQRGPLVPLAVVEMALPSTLAAEGGYFNDDVATMLGTAHTC